MELRKGRYALWCGTEYELTSYQRIYYLRSDDPSVQDRGFRPQPGKPGSFILEVTPKELDDAYEVIPYTIYHSHRFLIEGMTEDGKAVLVTNDPFAQMDLSVKPYGRHEFMLEVHPEEIDIAEERRSILGFDSRNNVIRNIRNA